jgi:outer membrane protein
MNKGILGILAATLVGGTAEAGDLLDVYRMALDNDASYRSAVFQRSIAAQGPTVARSELRPQVSLGAGANYGRESVDGNSDTFDSLSASLGLSQSLYDRRSSIALEQAELGDRQAGINLESAEDGVVIRAATQYFVVLGATDNLELATSEKIAIQRQLELARERLNVGIGTQTDLYDAQARFQIAEANEIQARNLIDDALQALIEIVGENPGDLARLREDAPLEFPDPNQVDAWIAMAMDANPDLRSSALGLEIARRDVERQQKLRHPSVSLNLSQDYSDSDSGANFGGGDRDSTSVGVQLAFPLYLGGSVAALVEQAGLNANIQEQSLELTRRQLDRSVRDLFNNVTTGVSRVNALNQAVIASESAVEAKQEGYAAGLITNLDVLDAQRDLFQARRDYLRARYDYILSVLRLEQSAGQLDEGDVARINGWLEGRG